MMIEQLKHKLQNSNTIAELTAIRDKAMDLWVHEHMNIQTWDELYEVYLCRLELLLDAP